MSDGNRSQLADAVTVLFIAAVIFFSAWAVWDWSASYTKNAIEADQGSRHYAADAQERIRRECTVPSTMPECVAKIVQATQENQRAEYDLSAQQDMAKWAWWMVAVSLLATIVTAIGIYFVRENLIAVREANAGTMRAVAAAERANEIASEGAKHQLRAYMTLNFVGLRKVAVDGRPEAVIEFINSGETPAVDVCAVIEIENMPFRMEGWRDADITLATSKSTVGKGSKVTMARAWDFELSVADMENLFTRSTGIFVRAYVIYKDIYSAEYFTKSQFVSDPAVDASSDDEWGVMIPCSRGNESN